MGTAYATEHFKIAVFKIQDGGRHHLEKSPYLRNKSTVVDEICKDDADLVFRAYHLLRI